MTNFYNVDYTKIYDIIFYIISKEGISMTKEQFLQTLSLKAQNIVKDNLKKFPNVTFKVYYADVSKMISEGNSNYIIYVKNDVLEDIEYRFLHEFFHCIQHEEGFPNLETISYKYKELSNSIMSLILDLDIRERLEDNGYFQDLKYIKKSISISIQLLKSIQRINNKEKLTSIDDFITYAGFLLTSDIAKINNKELFVLLSKQRPMVIRYYVVFTDSVKLYSYKNADGVSNIFSYILEKFKLDSFIKIQTH